MPLLFSYGTLQDPKVQLATFGRLLDGHQDAMIGFTTRMLAISNPEVVALSGEAEHPVVVPSDDPDEQVAGAVFRITKKELLAADEYESADYRRIKVVLLSGAHAWVYLAGDTP